MLARTLDARGKPQHVDFAKPCGRHNCSHGRLALRQRAGLVDHQGVDLFHMLKRFRVLDKNAGLCASSDTNHDRHRSGEAKRAWAGDDQHGDCCHKSIGEPRLGAPDRPSAKCQQRYDDHSRNEPSRHLIGHALNRRAAPLRLGDELHDLRQHRVAANFSRLDHQRTGLVHRAAYDICADLLGYWHRFTGYHQLIDGAATLVNEAINRHLFARPDAQSISDLNLIELHFFLGTITTNAASSFRCEVKKRTNCSAGGFTSS